MTDTQIIDLYFLRSEKAIEETAAQYGHLFYKISYNVLHNAQDAEECVNDTYLTAWHRIPPTRPNHLSVFLSRITRSLSIDRWRKRNASKRGGGQLTLAVEELDRTLSSGENIEENYIRSELTQLLNDFLHKLPETECQVFVCRYWYMDSIDTICEEFGFSASKVKTMLMRTRRKLKVYLEERGGYAV